MKTALIVLVLLLGFFRQLSPGQAITYVALDPAQGTIIRKLVFVEYRENPGVCLVRQYDLYYGLVWVEYGDDIPLQYGGWLWEQGDIPMIYCGDHRLDVSSLYKNYASVIYLPLIVRGE